MKKLFFLLSIFLAPYFVFAAWWNPFSWFESKIQQQPVPIVQPQVIEQEATQEKLSERDKEKQIIQEKVVERVTEKPVIYEKVITNTITIDNPSLLRRIQDLEVKIQDMTIQLNAANAEKQLCIQSKQSAISQSQAIQNQIPTLIIPLSSTRVSLLYGDPNPAIVKFKLVDQFSNTIPNANVYISKDGDTSQTYKSDSDGIVSYKLYAPPAKGSLKLTSGAIGDVFVFETYYYSKYPLAGLSVYGSTDNGKPTITLTNTTGKEDVIIKSIRSRMIGTADSQKISSVTITTSDQRESFPINKSTGYVIQVLPQPIVVKSITKLTFEISLSESQDGKTYGFNFENSDDIWGSISNQKIVPTNIGESDLIGL